MARIVRPPTQRSPLLCSASHGPDGPRRGDAPAGGCGRQTALPPARVRPGPRPGSPAAPARRAATVGRAGRRLAVARRAAAARGAAPAARPGGLADGRGKALRPAAAGRTGARGTTTTEIPRGSGHDTSPSGFARRPISAGVAGSGSAITPEDEREPDSLHPGLPSATFRANAGRGPGDLHDPGAPPPSSGLRPAELGQDGFRLVHLGIVLPELVTEDGEGPLIEIRGGGAMAQ